jgi:hypothetical protein
MPLQKTAGPPQADRFFNPYIPHLCADLPSPTEAGFAKAGARSDAQAQSAFRI